MSSKKPESAGSRLVCSKQDCPIAAGGLCIEGWEHPEDECETASAAGELAREDRDEEPDSPMGENVRLPSGLPIDVSQVRRMAGAVETLVVSIVGGKHSGKSTLLASIFEKFQSGPFGGCRFAGSRTLVGFDKLCHPGQARSGNLSPQTEATSQEEGLRFLHLALQRIHTGKRLELLFSERSGEHFEAFRSAATDARDFPDLKEAAIVLLLVDGSRLLGDATRATARHNALVTFRALAEQGVVGADTAVILTLSKVDASAGDPAAERALAEAFDGMAVGVRALFGNSRPFGVAKVASRSPGGACELGEGVDDLLRRILDAGEFRAATKPDVTPQSLGSPYDRFGPATLRRISS